MSQLCSLKKNLRKGLHTFISQAISCKGQFPSQHLAWSLGPEPPLKCLDLSQTGKIQEPLAFSLTSIALTLSTAACLGTESPSNCCRKGDPFQGLKLGSCLTLRNELSEETHVLTKQEILLGKGTRVESRRVREPRRTALSHGLQSWVLW